MSWLFKAPPLLVNHRCNPPKPKWCFHTCEVPSAGSLWQCDEDLCGKIWEVVRSESWANGFSENKVVWREYKE